MMRLMNKKHKKQKLYICIQLKHQILKIHFKILLIGNLYLKILFTVIFPLFLFIQHMFSVSIMCHFLDLVDRNLSKIGKACAAIEIALYWW